MTILVDAIQHYPGCGLRHKHFCHMSSTKDADELHAMAHLIGLKREWFQAEPYAHYDITPLRRAAAVKHGAQEVGAKDGLLRNFDYVARKAKKTMNLKFWMTTFHDDLVTSGAIWKPGTGVASEKDALDVATMMRAQAYGLVDKETGEHKLIAIGGEITPRVAEIWRQLLDRPRG